MAKTQQGREFHSHVQKKDGEEGILKDEFKRDGAWAKHAADAADNCSASAGLTISRGNYQFARIDVGLTFSFAPDTIAESDAFDIAHGIVDEILSREEAEIREVARAAHPLAGFGPSEGITGRSIYLAYGLTLNGAAKFESHRIDIGRTKRVADDADLCAEFIALGEQLGERITLERARIEGRSGDKGI